MQNPKISKLKGLLRNSFADARSFKEEGGYTNSISDAKNSNHLSPAHRIKDSYSYYEGKLPEPFCEGGSKVVDNVVFPKVRELTAAIGEIFDTTNNTVSYFSKDADTSLINTFIQKQLEDNNWGKQLQSLISEALIGGVSFIKRYFEVETVTKLNNYVGLDKEAFSSLKAANPDSKFTVDESYTETVEESVVDENGEVTGTKSRKVKLVDVTETYDEEVQGLKVLHIPQDEFYTLAHDSSIEDASYACHRKLMYRYEIREMFQGRKYSKVIDVANAGSQMEMVDIDNDFNSLQQIEGNISSADREHDKVFLFEHYIRFDKKLFQVFTIGDDSNLLDYYEVDEIPFSAFIPLRVSDSLWSMSVVDVLKPIQNAKTALMRGMLDNVLAANYGRYTAVKNQYDRKGLLHNTPGGVVEVNAPGMIDRFPYHALPSGVDYLSNYLGQQADDLAGSSQGSNGTAEKLFSSSATGAAIAASIKELREKDIARNLATTGLIPLYKALYKLTRQNLKEVQMITGDDGLPVAVQPSTWPEVIDVKVDIITNQDRAVKAQNVIIFNQQLTSFRQTAMSPQEWYGQAEALAESLGMPELMTDVMKPEEIQPPQPTEAEQLAMAKVQADIAESESRVRVAEIEAKVKLAEMELAQTRAALEAQVEATKAQIEYAKIASNDKNADLNRSFEKEKAALDAAITESLKTNVKIGQ